MGSNPIASAKIKFKNMEEGDRLMTPIGEGKFVAWTSKMGRIIQVEVDGQLYEFVPLDEVKIL